MAKRQIRVKCTGTTEKWTVDETDGADVTPLVKELQKYSDFAAILPPMGPGTKIIEVEVEDA